MNAVDTSVVVAAFASWHQGHEQATLALAEGARLPIHVAIETYSVLTRLPAPHRAPAQIVTTFLASTFPGEPLSLPASEQLALLGLLARAGVTGGAVYDALVGATARHADATLLTRDRRAIPTYEAVGAAYRLVG